MAGQLQHCKLTLHAYTTPLLTSSDYHGFNVNDIKSDYQQASSSNSFIYIVKPPSDAEVLKGVLLRVPVVV